MCIRTAMTVLERELQQFQGVPPQWQRGGEGFVHPQTVSPPPLGYVVPGDGPVYQLRNGIYDWTCLNHVYGEDVYVFAIPYTEEHRARGWRCIYCGDFLGSLKPQRGPLKKSLLSLQWQVHCYARAIVAFFQVPKTIGVFSQALGVSFFGLSIQAHPPLSWISLCVSLLAMLICIGMAVWILAVQLIGRYSASSSRSSRWMALAMLLFEVGLSGWMLWSGLYHMHW
jgi:hypothetical protein